MFYADDTQIYISFTASEISALLPRVTNCIREVKEWSRLNGLMLNSKKTEVLHLSSRFRSHTCSSFPPIEIDGSQVLPVKRQEILGLFFMITSRCMNMLALDVGQPHLLCIRLTKFDHILTKEPLKD